MRWVLVAAFCAAVAAAILLEARADDGGRRLVIHDAMPFADFGDPNLLGNQLWGVRPRFSVEPPCDGLRLSAGSRVLFNGEPVAGGGEMDGSAGDTVVVSARARCRDGWHAQVERTFELPTASCDAGPLRVYDVRGSATSYDWNHDDRPFALAPGHLVSPGSDILVSRGGSIVLGAPECNELRVQLFGGRSTVGGYERSGRGDSFSGVRIFARADRHAGAFWVPGGPRGAERALVLPIADRTSYAVRSSPRRVVVRVWRGAALVSGGQGRSQVRVGPGEQSSVTCAHGRCRAGAARTFQPREPWFTPADGRRRELGEIVYGERPPPGRLAPSFSRTHIARLRAAGGAPEQLAVTWDRQVRRSSSASIVEQGVVLWEREAGPRWRRVYSRRSALGMTLHVTAGDVTGDKHPDVLIEEWLGTGACGPRRLLAYAGGRVRQLFVRDFCEGGARLDGNALRVDQAVGPCPFRDMSAHCRGGFRTTILRWHGPRLVFRKESVRCNLPRLDPATNCARNRAQGDHNTA